MSKFKPSLIIGAIFALVIIGVVPVFADEWRKYENDYFIAYSSANPVKALKILREMEQFRSAALQVFAMRVPDDAPKTIVVVPGKWRQYVDLGGSRYIGGYARQDGRRGVLVVPSTRLSERRLRTVRHEYAHALLYQDGVDYPSWYHEGFAELASSIEMSKAGDSFFLGRETDRKIGYTGSVAVNWDELIKDNFNLWSVQVAGGVAAAYGQSWLLMHYVLLGPNQEYREGFPVYLAGLKTGLTSHEAWKLAFKKMPMEMWQAGMRDYSSRLPYLELHFRGITYDDDFDMQPAPSDELEALLRFIKTPMEADGQKRVKDLPLEHYEGQWAKIGVFSQCTNPIHVEYSDSERRFTIRWQKNLFTDAYPEPAHYSVKDRQGGNLQLDKVGARESDDRWQRSFVLSYRESGIMCLTRTTAPPNYCDIPYVRCGESSATTLPSD